jgi:hypothetical protein
VNPVIEPLTNTDVHLYLFAVALLKRDGYNMQILSSEQMVIDDGGLVVIVGLWPTRMSNVSTPTPHSFSAVATIVCATGVRELSVIDVPFPIVPEVGGQGNAGGSKNHF